MEGTVQQQASKRARRGKQITGLRQRHRRPPGGAWVVQRLPSRSGRWRSRLPCRAASAELKTERDGVHEQTGSRCRCWAPGPGQSLLDPAYISPLRSRLRVQSITKGVSSIPAVLRKGRVITDVLAELLHRRQPRLRKNGRTAPLSQVGCGATQMFQSVCPARTTHAGGGSRWYVKA